MKKLGEFSILFLAILFMCCMKFFLIAIALVLIITGAILENKDSQGLGVILFVLGIIMLLLLFT
ncbi:MAG: hypothetical protein WCW02_00430 [Candidatus Buchananbacteria bacterium]